MNKSDNKGKRHGQQKTRLCAQSHCQDLAATKGFCRLHYIANWRHIKLNARIKAEQKLNAFVDRLAKKYPEEYLEKIREGLEDEAKFRQTVEEIDLEATEVGSPETENEFLEKFMRDIKGSGTGGE